VCVIFQINLDVPALVVVVVILEVEDAGLAIETPAELGFIIDQLPDSFVPGTFAVITLDPGHAV
jgi:hypothetical protein